MAAPALALLDAQKHAITVDVGDLQMYHFAGAQAGAIGHGQGGPVLGIAGAGQQALDFFDAEDARQLLGWAHAAGAP